MYSSSSSSSSSSSLTFSSSARSMLLLDDGINASNYPEFDEFMLSTGPWNGYRQFQVNSPISSRRLTFNHSPQTLGAPIEVM